MRTETLYEITQSHHLAVDTDAGKIRGVRVLGPTSVNGRKYPTATVTKARELYEGKNVNTNHPSRENPNEDRSVGDRIGWLEGVSVDGDGGLVGDLNLLKSHPLTAAVMEAAERNPRLFGLSHNVEGKTRRENGITIVEEITRVRSVDLVSDPASTKSLFEHQEPTMKTVKAVLENVFKGDNAKLTMIREMEGELGEPVAAEMEEPAGDVDADTQIKAAMRTAVMAAFDDESLDTQATVTKIKDILKAQDKLLGKDGGDTEEPAEEPAEEEETPPVESELIKPVIGELQKLKEQIAELKATRSVETPLSGQRTAAKTDDGWTPPKDLQEAKSRLYLRR